MQLPQDLNRRIGKTSSQSWLFPLKGIYFFVTHSFLWPLLRARLLPGFLLSAFVLATLFIWTYLPQVAFLRLFHGRGAWLNATFLVLGEGAAITALLFEAFLVDEAMVDAFDAVLIHQGLEHLVAITRPVDSDESMSPVRRLGKPHHSSVYSPFSLRQIVEFMIFLPLNFVPWIGVPLFLWLTGYRAGPLHHWRLFKLKQFTKSQSNQFLKQRRLGYTTFGASALALQLVPVLSMLFLLTTATGSALWASQLESSSESNNGYDDNYQPTSDAADSPPDYDDDPT